MLSKIILDVSRYQPQIDYGYLKSFGQNYIVIKGGSGNLTIDRKFEQHYNGAHSVGMVVSPYFWVDPIYDPIRQAQFFLSLIKYKDIGFIVLDFEQWWGDWQKWSEWNAGLITKSQVPLISPERMLTHFKAVYNYMSLNTNKNIVVYTAPWFLNAYCKTGYTFLQDKYTHWADYSLFNTVKMYGTWSYLESIVPVGKRIPTLPTWYPMNKVLLWQFSGDKFTAPRVWGNEEKTRLSALDLNYWVNQSVSIESICQLKPSTEPEPEPTPEPEPEEPPLETWEVWSTSGVNIRQYPTASSLKLGTLLYKEKFQITSNTNGWGKLYNREGYTSLYYSKRIETTPTAPVEATTRWTITAYVLNIRKAASASSEIIGSFKYGTIVEISSIANGWGKLYGRDGYISMAYAKQVT